MSAMPSSRESAELAMLEYFTSRGVPLEAYEERFRQDCLLIEPGNIAWYRKHSIPANLVANRWGIAFTFLGPDGEPYLNAERVPYVLVRWLGTPTDRDGNPIDDVPKCCGPSGRKSEIHFPKLISDSYQTWAEQPTSPVLLHCESALKAEVVYVSTGKMAIGGSGVRGFSAKKRGIEFIHKYLPLDFTKFDNVIVYDSDAAPGQNAAVRSAQQLLAYQLRHTLLCPKVRVADLPCRPDGTNWGLDDYVAANGADAFDRLVFNAPDHLGEEHIELTQRVNTECIYVLRTDMVYAVETGQLKSIDKARSHFAALNKPVLVGKKTSIVKGIDTWLQSSHRREVDDTGYRYLGALEYEVDGVRYANTYRKDGVWPTGVRGPLSSGAILREAVEVCLGSEENIKLFWSWLRYLKFTDGKIVTYLQLYSDKRGIGKGWIIALVEKLLGRGNSNVAGDAKDFVGQFNSAIANFRFIAVNEFHVDFKDREAFSRMLKNAVGDKSIRVEAKYQDAKQAEANAGFIFAANSLSEFPMDGLADRRAIPMDCDVEEDRGAKWIEEHHASKWQIVHDIVEGKAGPDGEEALEDLAAWLRDSPEIEDIDFSSYRPKLTDARLAKMAEGLAPVARAAMNLRLEILNDLDANGAPLWAVKRCWTWQQIYQRCGDLHGPPPSPAKMAGWLRDAGWVSSASLRIGDPKQDWRVGRKPTRTTSGVWFPDRRAAEDVSSDMAGEHAFRHPNAGTGAKFDAS